MNAPPFEGFTREAIDFLAELALNNDRAWFQPRKAEYERLLKAPLASLCAALAERFIARDIPLVADPARSPFRIYRDTRFTKDKAPYKTNVGASFAWRAADGAAAPGEEAARGPGGYFHLEPGDIFAGGGMWHPQPARLAAWRHAVSSRPEAVHAVLADPAFTRTFGQVDGHRLTRMPAGFAADHPEADLLRLTDVGFWRRLSDSEALSPDLPDLLADLYADAVPVLRFLNALD